MLVSYKWLCEIAGINVSAHELAKMLTFAGLEVEGIEQVGALLEKVVVGEVREKTSHPSRDNLSVVKVDSGKGVVQVVCGAPNCPGPGGRVVLALPGARLGEMEIAKRKLGGVESSGMICSELELNIGPGHEGVLVLEDEISAPPGTAVTDALGLGDWILNIGITPNRPDALSHRGIARDAALLCQETFRPAPRIPADEGGSPVDAVARVEILDPERCPRYGAAVLTGIKVGPSPFAVRYRLHNLGIRPINNIVDATNLVMLEWGQPLHAFDLDELAESKIIVRRAKAGETIVTLDEVERELSEEDLLICDAARPVAVAGVMGGEHCGVTAKTERVLIECAYFDPSSVRRTSKSLKLSSESSYRFERGIDPSMGPDVLAATTALMTELAGGKQAPGFIDNHPKAIEPHKVSFRPERFRQLMGFAAAPKEIERILSGLGCGVKKRGESFEVTVPLSRPDITREVDLVEEVARIRGFEDVPSTLPRVRCLPPQRAEFDAARRVKEIMCSLGLQEAVSYSFVSDSVLEVLGCNRDVVHIANPLSSERKAMRTTLVPGLVESLKRAQSRFLPGIAQFEVGRTFHESGRELPHEELKVAALVSGPVPGWLGDAPRSYDFYDIKGIAEAFVRQTTSAKLRLLPGDKVPYLHPKRSVAVFVKDVNLGNIGELHPEVAAKLKLSRGVCLMELSVDELWKVKRKPEAAALPEFPPMTRDVALLLDEKTDAGPVGEALAQACTDLGQKVELFDVYTGKGIPAGKKSLAFSIEYRAPDRTLTDKEVDDVHRRAVDEVIRRFDAKQR